MPQVVPITFQELAEKHAGLEKEYAAFKQRVKEMLEAQQAYFKRGKDIHLLKASKAIEKEVRDLITPPVVKVAQATMDFLGQ